MCVYRMIIKNLIFIILNLYNHHFVFEINLYFCNLMQLPFGGGRKPAPPLPEPAALGGGLLACSRRLGE